MLLLSLRSAVGLYFLAEPLVALLYERGAFTSQDSAVTAMITQYYAFLLITSGLTKILVTAFYAKKDTTTPALLSAASVVFHLVFANYATLAWGVKGLVLSTVISSGLNALATIVFCEWKVIRVAWLRVGAFFLRALPGNLAVGAICVVGFPEAVGALGLSSDLAVAVVIPLTMVVYFAVCWVLGVEELRTLEARLRARLSRRRA
jgi:putative peptidoglycan lipid II flippase